MIFMRSIRDRRRAAKTDYSKRMRLLKGGIPRLVVRRSNRGIRVQVIEYSASGDKTIASASSKELKAAGWEPRSNIPTAYLTGFLLGGKVKGRGMEFILDTGLYKPIKGSIIFAAAKGFKDSGANLRGSIEFDEKRLSGSHIASYAGTAQDKFPGYAKAGFDVKRISEKFESVKGTLQK